MWRFFFRKDFALRCKWFVLSFGNKSNYLHLCTNWWPWSGKHESLQPKFKTLKIFNYSNALCTILTMQIFRPIQSIQFMVFVLFQCCWPITIYCGVRMEARVNNCFDRPTILCSLHELQEKKIQQNILLKRHKKSDIFLRNLESDIQYFRPKKNYPQENILQYSNNLCDQSHAGHVSKSCDYVTALLHCGFIFLKFFPGKI